MFLFCFCLFFLSPSVTEHWGWLHDSYSPYWERDFINLYSLTSFQHIFMQYDVNIFFLWKCFGLFCYRRWHRIVLNQRPCLDISRFSFLPVRLPPVFLDFTSPDANIYSVKRAVSEIFFRGYQRRGQVLVLFESLLDESQPTWLLIAANSTKKRI